MTRSANTQAQAVLTPDQLILATVAFVPEGDTLFKLLRRDFVRGVVRNWPSKGDLFVDEHPLPLLSPSVCQRNAFTGLVGSSATNAVFISAPARHVALRIVSFADIGRCRAKSSDSAEQWRTAGCFDVFTAPREILNEASSHLGIVSSSSEAWDRAEINARLQFDADCASALFAHWVWLKAIRHRLQVEGVNGLSTVATIRQSTAGRMFSRIGGTERQVQFTRTSKVIS